MVVTLSKVFLRRLGGRITRFTINTQVSGVCRPSGRRLILSLHSHRNTRGLLLSYQTGATNVCFAGCPPRGPAGPPVLYVLLHGRLYNNGVLSVRRRKLSEVVGVAIHSSGRLKSRILLALITRVVNECDGVVLLSSGNAVVSTLHHISRGDSHIHHILPKLGCRTPPTRSGLSVLASSVRGVGTEVSGDAGSPTGTFRDTIVNISPVIYHRCRGNASIRRVGRCTRGPHPGIVMARTPFSFYFVPVARCNSLTDRESFRAFSRALSFFCCRGVETSEVHRHSNRLFGALSGLGRHTIHGTMGEDGRLRSYHSGSGCGVCNSLVITGRCTLRGNTVCCSLRGFCRRGTQIHIPTSPTLSPVRGTRGCCGRCHGGRATRDELSSFVGTTGSRTTCLSSMASTLSETRASPRVARVGGRLIRANFLGHHPTGGRGGAGRLHPVRFRDSRNFGVFINHGGVVGSGLALGATGGCSL